MKKILWKYYQYLYRLLEYLLLFDCKKEIQYIIYLWLYGELVQVYVHRKHNYYSCGYCDRNTIIIVFAIYRVSRILIATRSTLSRCSARVAWPLQGFFFCALINPLSRCVCLQKNRAQNRYFYCMVFLCANIIKIHNNYNDRRLFCCNYRQFA